MIQENRSRIISLVIAFFIFLVSLSSLSVSAATELSNRELLDLKAFGILEGDENGELNLDKTITRAEFSKVVVKMTQNEDAAGAMSSGMYFSDMTPEHWAYGYVMVLASLGLINGMPDGSFCPEQEITYHEAVKILVNALGYYSIAEENGGYPVGYAITGGQIGITRGVLAEGETALLRADAMRLVYNCLDATRMEYVSTDANGNVSIKQSSQTLRDLLMGNKRNGLAEIRAVISANYDSWLYAPVPDIEKWQVEADKTLFNQGTSGAENYLGQEVDMYIRSNSTSGQYVIEQIMPTKNNTILHLDRMDVQSLERKQIQYTDGNDKIQTRAISESAVYLYNGRAIDFKDLKFDDIDNGTVELISNDGDSVFDVVMVRSYESFEVDAVDVENKQIVLTADKKFNGQRKISLDDEANDLNTKLLDRDAAVMGLEEVNKGDIVSVFASADGQLIRIMVSSLTAEGMVTELRDKNDNPQIMIDEESYFVEKDVDLNNLVGSEITAKINFEGKVVSYQRGTVGKKYAAIIGVAAESDFGGEVSAKVVLPGTLSEEKEELEDTGESQPEDSVPVLSAKNAGVKVFQFASKVRFGEMTQGIDPETGEEIDVLSPRTYSNTEMKERIEREMHSTGRNYVIVSYKLNKDGQISRLDYPETAGTFASRTYNAYEKTFGKSVGGAFGVTDKTLSICIPSEGINTEDDYLAKVKMTNNQSYDVIGYDHNKTTYCPDLIVISAPMSYTSPGNILTTSKIAIVTDVATCVDENGDLAQQATLLTPDGEKTYFISDHSATDQDLSAIQAGDVMYYSLDGMEYLDGYELLSSCKPIPTSKENIVGDSLVYVGSVLDVNYNVVSNTINRWVDEMICTTDDNLQRTFEVRHESTPPIYIYYSSNDTVELGDRLDLLSPHQRVIVCATATTRQVKAIIMIV